jgi:signal transduction histidine kinase
MAIAREVITLMGGSVEVASTLNVGTSVTFWLPASNTAQTAAT